MPKAVVSYRGVLVAGVTLALMSACGAIEEYSKLRTPTGRTLQAGARHAVFRINKDAGLTEPLGPRRPLGRKVDTGWVDLPGATA